MSRFLCGVPLGLCCQVGEESDKKGVESIQSFLLSFLEEIEKK
jgi:hypothetical protein